MYTNYKILIVGYGNIAIRHIDNIREVVPDAEICVLRQHHRTLVDNDAISKTFFDENSALDFEPDIAFITSPAPLHIETACRFAIKGIHLYIEKPLSNSLDGLTDLKALIKQKHCRVIVGYILRFNAAIRALKSELDAGRVGTVFSAQAIVGQWLPDWRPTKNYRETVTAREELGGGVLLELSHEVDYLRFLFGEVESITCMASRQSNLDLNVEDNADLILRFSSGTVANLHLDCLRRDAVRTCVVQGEKGTLLLNLQTNCLEFFDAETLMKTELLKSNETPPNQMYLECLKDFFNSIQTDSECSIPFSEGVKTLTTTLAARQSANEERTIRIGVIK